MKMWAVIGLMLAFFTAISQVRVPVNICFQHNFEGKEMHADSVYLNRFGDRISIRQWKYYIGSLMLDNEPILLNGDKYALINAIEGKVCVLGAITPGNYGQLRFRIGIDPSDQSSGVRSGSLDPLNNMYWTWNSGYIAFKLEGENSSAPPPLHRFEHHLGGYREGQVFQPMVILNHAQAIALNADHNNEILIDVDLHHNCESTDPIRSKSVIMQPGPAAMAQSEAVVRLFEWIVMP